MHGAAILSGTPQGKANDVLASPIQGRANDAGRGVDTRIISTTHPDNQHDPSGYKSSGWSIKVKRVLHAITAGSHGPHPITCRMRRQEEVTATIRRMIVLPANTYCHHHNRKYLLTINERNSTPEASLAKMATPSQSRSSGREEEDNHEWRQAIEKRQLASEKQLKALLQETERLREENAVLRIQASTSGPPHRQRSKGQVANSKPEPESIYPGSTGAIQERTTQGPMSHGTPMPRAPREESSDSTHFSAKRQRDRKSQLSSSMRARLGHKSLGDQGHQQPQPGRHAPIL
ncbi:hypothetical protein CK203_035323 [Vitis vinifera]|uniref:Uncharacterized protein n=1 Tax=Vitis vinifera TaxID=29760 RepID=A0A438HN59_VITVI|nr:hypothetical protein CK203_035323 [Vitis vinifera]